jgi:hypothetical protein
MTVRYGQVVEQVGIARFEACSHDEYGRHAIRGEPRPGTCPVCGPMPQLLSEEQLAARERRERKAVKSYPWQK